jgi:hypothetical protein
MSHAGGLTVLWLLARRESRSRRENLRESEAWQANLLEMCRHCDPPQFGEPKPEIVTEILEEPTGCLEPIHA